MSDLAIVAAVLLLLNCAVSAASDTRSALRSTATPLIVDKTLRSEKVVIDDEIRRCGGGAQVCFAACGKCLTRRGVLQI